MVVVFVLYGTEDHAPPTKPQASEPHAGAQHHSNEKHEGDQPSPLPVFANANVGDWTAYETSTTLADGRPTVKTSIVTIEATDDETVTIVRNERSSSLEPPVITRGTRSRKRTTIDELVTNNPAEWTLHSLVISDEPHDVGGRTFAAKKLAFGLTAPLGRTTSAVEAWFSSDVPGDGMLELRQTLGGTRLVVANRLLGFGTASAITWGSKPDGL